MEACSHPMKINSAALMKETCRRLKGLVFDVDGLWLLYIRVLRVVNDEEARAEN